MKKETEIKSDLLDLSILHDLDTAINNNDVSHGEKILETYSNKQALKNHLNEKLYDLICPPNSRVFHAPASDEIIKKIKTLLMLGADPNYINDTSEFTMLAKAVLAQDIRLIRTLLNHNANPEGHTTKEGSISKEFSPLQIASNAYIANSQISNALIFNLLSSAFINTHEEALEKQFESAFKFIIEAVKQSKTEAEQANKRLMILIGEEHYSFNSFFVELMTYLVAYEAFGINTVLEETDQEALDYFNKTGAWLTRGNQWMAAISFLKAVKKNKATIIPSDPLQAEHRGASGESESVIAERNQSMASNANQCQSDVICIIGQGHMYGMLHKTDLEKNFHVCSISTTKSYSEIQKSKKSNLSLEEFDKQSHDIKMHEFNIYFPEKVKNLNIFQNKTHETAISPDKGSEIILKLFKKLVPEITAKKSPLVFSGQKHTVVDVRSTFENTMQPIPTSITKSNTPEVKVQNEQAFLQAIETTAQLITNCNVEGVKTQIKCIPL